MLTQNVELAYGIAEGFAVISGITLVLLGFMGLKRHAEMRGMMGQQQSMAKPLMLIVCGSMLLTLPSILPALVTTLFSSSQDSQYQGPLSSTGLILFIHFLGLCSVIKGIIMLSKTGGHSAQPGMRGKALIHLFAGVLLLHISEVTSLAQNFFFS